MSSSSACPASDSHSHAYIGRFAPSPTGPLHFGSLLSALASYLDARQQQGQWLVRMEDLDPPREQPGAADAILHALEMHGLKWDNQVIYQSQRHQAYEEALEQLHQAGLVYPCSCSRQRLQLTGGIYDGHCRRHPPPTAKPTAQRLKVAALPPTAPADITPDIHFHDRIQGSQHQDLANDIGDFIVRRKDRLFAYQLAVVIDDIHQGITHIIRGSDLLDSTPRQLYLFTLLGASLPKYGHIPVALNREGHKLSKQNLSPALVANRASDNLWQALVFLQQSPPTELQGASVEDILDWTVIHWRAEALPHSMGLPAPTCFDHQPLADS